MRLALIFAGLTALTACGDKSETAGPERRSAAGEVLGGEVTDAMLPLDTVRSTSPADASAVAGAKASADAPTGPPPADDAPSPQPATRATTLPKPEVSGGPVGRQPDVPPVDDR